MDDHLSEALEELSKVPPDARMAVNALGAYCTAQAEEMGISPAAAALGAAAVLTTQHPEYWMAICSAMGARPGGEESSTFRAFVETFPIGEPAT